MSDTGGRDTLPTIDLRSARVSDSEGSVQGEATWITFALSIPYDSSYKESDLKIVRAEDTCKAEDVGIETLRCKVWEKVFTPSPSTLEEAMNEY